MTTSQANAVRAGFLKLIQGWKWFAYVPAEGQEWLAEHMCLKQFAKGKTIYTSAEPVSYLYAVVSGVFRIYLASPKGDEITLEEVVHGGWFPHFVPVPQPTYLGNCVCQQDATVAAVPQAAIAEFSRRWPGYYHGLYHELANRAVVTLGRIELLSLHNLNVRLAVYLLRMARLRGRPEAGGAIWLAAFESQSEVGARVGGTRQRVNGVLKSWVKKGWIEMHKDGIHILDVQRLTAEAMKTGFGVAEFLAGYHGGWQGTQ